MAPTKDPRIHRGSTKSQRIRTEVWLLWRELSSAWEQHEQVKAVNMCAEREDPGTLQIQVGEGPKDWPAERGRADK